MSNASVLFFTFLFGGLGIVGLSRIAPTLAVGFTSAVTVAVLLSHTNEFLTVTNRITTSLGEKPYNPKG